MRRRQNLPEVVCRASTLPPPTPPPPTKKNLVLERKKPPECSIQVISHQRLLTLAVVWHWHQPNCLYPMKLPEDDGGAWTLSALGAACWALSAPCRGVFVPCCLVSCFDSACRIF